MSLAADSYLCASDLTTGFSPSGDGKTWVTSKFKAEDKFIIARAEDVQKTAGFVWVVKPIGSKTIHFACKADFSEHGYLQCEGMGQFQFNRKTNRFLRTYTFGYVNDGAVNDNPLMAPGANTPYIEIGRCSQL